MALAVLKAEIGQSGKRAFRFDIGSNKFYRVAVGDDQTREKIGIKLLANPVWISPLVGPLDIVQLGRGRLEIDEQHFDRQNRFVQLMSYRNSSLDGPAVSDIIESITSFDGAGPPTDIPLNFGLGDPTFSVGNTSGHTSPRPVKCRWKNKLPGKAMSFDIVGLLQSVIGGAPKIAELANGLMPIISKLLSSKDDSAPVAPGQLKDIANGNGGAIIDLLKNVITGLVTQPSQAKSLASPRKALYGQSLASCTSARRAMAELSYKRIGGRPQPYGYAQIVDGGLITGPLVADLVAKVLPAVIDGIKDLAKTAIQARKQEMDHIEHMVPKVDDPSFDSLVSASGGMGYLGSLDYHHRSSSNRNHWKNVDSVKLDLDGSAHVNLGGKLNVFYAAGNALVFPITIKRQGNGNSVFSLLNQCVVNLTARATKNGDTLMRRSWSIRGELSDGLISEEIGMSASEAAKLPLALPMKFEFVLTWKTRSGSLRGTSFTYETEILGPLAFDHFEGKGESIALDDRSRFEDYWHRVWAGRFNPDLKRYELDVRYLLAMNIEDGSQNRRIEPIVKVQPREGLLATSAGRLLSGTEFTLQALDRLKTILFPHVPELSRDEIEALSNIRFAEAFHRLARCRLEFRGRSGTPFTVWTYPSFSSQTVVLRSIANVNSFGQITAMEDRKIRVLVPTDIHFVVTGAQ
jgi:hypothetical protein